MFSQVHCLIAIIKSLGHKEAGLIDPPQAHVQNPALLWLYWTYIYNGETGSREDAVKEACDAISQVLLKRTDYRS